MTGLLIKDIYNIRKQALWYVALIVFFCILSISIENIGFSAAIGMVVTVNIPLMAIAYEERDGWQKFVIASGVKIRKIVLEKYLLGLLFTAASSIALFVLLMFTVQDNPTVVFALSVFMQIATLCVSMPITFKFGVEKSRVYLMVAIVVLMAIFVALMSLMEKTLSELAADGLAICLLLLVAAIVVFAVSYSISNNIYSKKEF